METLQDQTDAIEDGQEAYYNQLFFEQIQDTETDEEVAQTFLDSLYSQEIEDLQEQNEAIREAQEDYCDELFCQEEENLCSKM
jgi:uncharacterized protein YbaP (TraB family)